MHASRRETKRYAHWKRWKEPASRATPPTSTGTRPTLPSSSQSSLDTYRIIVARFTIPPRRRSVEMRDGYLFSQGTSQWIRGNPPETLQTALRLFIVRIFRISRVNCDRKREKNKNSLRTNCYRNLSNTKITQKARGFVAVIKQEIAVAREAEKRGELRGSLPSIVLAKNRLAIVDFLAGDRDTELPSSTRAAITLPILTIRFTRSE